VSAAVDRFDVARSVADAVLYEGYVLYPYRASARKNQVRWQFGVLVPPAVAARDPSERSACRTECVVDPSDAPVLHVRVRFLHAQRRTLEVSSSGTGANEWIPVAELDVDGTRWAAWDEAVEREIDVGSVPLLPLAGATREVPVHVAGHETVETLRDRAGNVAGRAVRRCEPLDAVVRVRAEWAPGLGALIRLGVAVENVGDDHCADSGRDEVTRHSLVAVHVLLGVDDAVFVSLLDPPDDARAAVGACVNTGMFPVLVDDDTVMLSSPIILYDHPEVAPESQGDLFDATEIDEILALRVLTLTDDEKAEARGTDVRAAQIVDRVDAMAPDAWARLHGTVRELRPVGRGGDAPDVTDVTDVTDVAEPALPWWEPSVDASVNPWSDTVMVGGVQVGAGASVRLHPSRRADAHDMFLRDMVATVAGVFRDVDGELHVAVTVDDDPASVELVAHGRYLFFHPDEIEPLTDAEAAP
jgi:hypothetical protein